MAQTKSLEYVKANFGRLEERLAILETDREMNNTRLGQIYERLKVLEGCQKPERVSNSTGE